MAIRWRVFTMLLVGLVAAALVPAPAHGAPVGQGTAPGPNCAWQIMSDGDVFNAAFPDSNATYWVLPYVLGPGDSITLDGRFPQARYFSLNTYGKDLNTIDTLRDSQIRPGRGSGNPYRTPGARGGSWRAKVVEGSANRDRNELRGASGTGGPQIGSLILRIYVPDDARSPSGGVPLPTVTMKVGGLETVLKPCAQPFDPRNYSGPVAAAATALFDGFLQAAASSSFPENAPDATFINPETTAGLFPNGDNKYIGAGLKYRPGRVAVVRAKAPSFPDTRHGVSPAQAGTDLRYWAMCQNDKVSPYPVVACAADFQTKLDSDGYYTYVVAADNDRTGLTDPDLTILPWGSTAVAEKVIFLRNMLPSDAYYPRSVQASQAAKVRPERAMGEYYPRATYCAAEVLRTRGWRACYR